MDSSVIVYFRSYLVLPLQCSSFNGVDAQSTGGAIHNVGELNLLGGSLFLSNYASSSGDGGLGGGIFNSDDGAVT